MSLLDYNEQFDWVQRMQLENEAQIEQQVREAAQRYLELNLDHRRSLAVVPMNFAANSAPPLAGMTYSPTVDYRVLDVKIDVHPGITGFERRLIAEEQIREQIGPVDLRKA